MTAQIDHIKNAIRHIQTAVDVDPWAVEIAVDAMEKQIPQAQDVPDTNVGDTISRQAAIDCFWNKERYFRDALDVIKDIRQLPSAQPKIIRCKDCKYFELDHFENQTGSRSR